MSSRVAVVTDAISPDFILPIWYRYYSGLFGAKNIFVITYAGSSSSFREFDLGGLIELPVGWDDATRRDVISRFVSSLLPCYDAVIRVEVDEFLVIDPRTAPSLAAFLQTNMDGPYLTARGFDVTQMPDEAALPQSPDFPILRDRAYAYPNTALNKTCIVKTPVTWSNGFHWATVPPKFGPLFMLHLKRVDIGWQIRWFAKMIEVVNESPKAAAGLKEYYLPDEEKIRTYHKGVSGRRRISGMDSWYREELTKKFLDQVEFEPKSGFFRGKYDHELVLCEIPEEWKAIL